MSYSRLFTGYEFVPIDHEFVPIDHEFVPIDYEFVPIDHEFVVCQTFPYCKGPVTIKALVRMA